MTDFPNYAMELLRHTWAKRPTSVYLGLLYQPQLSLCNLTLMHNGQKHQFREQAEELAPVLRAATSSMFSDKFECLSVMPDRESPFGLSFRRIFYRTDELTLRVEFSMSREEFDELHAFIAALPAPVDTRLNGIAIPTRDAVGEIVGDPEAVRLYLAELVCERVMGLRDTGVTPHPHVAEALEAWSRSEGSRIAHGFANLREKS